MKLEEVIPDPNVLEINGTDVATSPEHTWQVARHVDLGRAPLIRALFAVRTLPGRVRGQNVEAPVLRIDDIVASDRPGFRLLAESERELVVGAIGKVWELDIPFVDVKTAEEFSRFAMPGYAKVAWALRVLPKGDGSRIEVEVRVSTTDPESLRRFRRYFRLIGPASHWIRRQVLSSLTRELDAPEAAQNDRPLPGDELLPDAITQVTDQMLAK